MKYILFIFVSVFIAVSCIDDETNLDYKEVNEYENWKVEGIDASYSLFPGESVTLTPKVRLSIDSLNPDLSYSWLLDGKEVSTEASYTFTADVDGDYELIFNAIDNKTSVAFPKGTTMNVTPLYKLGWLFLGRTASGASRLDMLITKRQTIHYLLDGKYDRWRDSLLNVQFATGLGEQLGTGPIKLVEEFSYDDYVSTENSEVMVLQESGPVELSGNALTYTGRPFDEFMGTFPENLVIRDVALSKTSKWLLAENGLLYYAVANVMTDLHSGRYNDDPAFNGMKFTSLIQTSKADNDYYINVVPAIDTEGTMWAFYDESSKDNKTFILDPKNEVGRKLEIRNNTAGEFDMSLFQKFKGERIKDCFVSKHDYLLSLLKLENGTCVWHRYAFGDHKKAADFIGLEESQVRAFANQSMFTDFKDAAYFHYTYGYDPNTYDDYDWLFIAAGNQLYGCSMVWEGIGQQPSEHFYTAPVEIQSIKIRYIRDLDYILVGVLMVDGTFEVLEVKRSEEERFVYKSVYKENLKTLDPEMMDVVDFIPKWGSGANLYQGTCL